MNDDLQQLRHVLQALALPVIGQVRLVPDDCRRIGALIGAINAAYPPVCAEIDAPITAAQGDALARLEAQLARVCGEATSPLRSELALRQSPRMAAGTADGAGSAVGLWLDTGTAVPESSALY
jgi:hypothetical protein